MPVCTLRRTSCTEFLDVFHLILRSMCVFFVTPFPFCAPCVDALLCVQVVLFIPNFIGKTSDARAVLKDQVSLVTVRGSWISSVSAITPHPHCHVVHLPIRWLVVAHEVFLMRMGYLRVPDGQYFPCIKDLLFAMIDRFMG